MKLRLLHLYMFKIGQSRQKQGYKIKHKTKDYNVTLQGQNTHSIAVITQELNYLTWEEAFTCLSDDRLPDQLRAMYCDLIISK